MSGEVPTAIVRLLETAIALTRIAEEIEQTGKIFAGTAAGISLQTIRNRLVLDVYALRGIAALAERELARKSGGQAPQAPPS